MNHHLLENALRFTKLNGTGNDFIVFDNRENFLDEHCVALTKIICDPHRGLGADGMILIQKSACADIRVRFFNCDGGEFNMCLNGSRCAARYAFRTGIAPRTMRMETNVTTLEACVEGREVALQFETPYRLRLHQHFSIDEQEFVGHWVKLGEPHLVCAVADIEIPDFISTARATRYHPTFAPEGTNAHFFMAHATNNKLSIRSYERGIEFETLSCGSGCVSTALALVEEARQQTTSGNEKGMSEGQFEFRTRHGGTLRISIHVSAESAGAGHAQVSLRGPTTVVADGEISAELWEEARQ